MEKAALIAEDFAIGPDIVRALDRSELPINVALWLYYDEFDDWRFALACRRLDAVALADAFGLVHDARNREYRWSAPCTINSEDARCGHLLFSTGMALACEVRDQPRPVDGKRHEEFARLFAKSKAGLV